MDVKQVSVAVAQPRAFVQRPPVSVPDTAGPSDFASVQRKQADGAERKLHAEAPKEQAPDPLERANEILNDTLGAQEPANSRLRVELDEGSGRFIYKSVDAETGEVIRQYPPEQVLRRLAFYRELQGLTVNEKA